MKKKKWIGILVVLLALGGVAFMKAKSGKTDPKAENTPFRLGKVQAEDLQVSVREVGARKALQAAEVEQELARRELLVDPEVLRQVAELAAEGQRLPHGVAPRP